MDGFGIERGRKEGELREGRVVRVSVLTWPAQCGEELPVSH